MDPKDYAFHFEARKVGYVENGNGVFLRLQLDPCDIPRAVKDLAHNQRIFVVVTPMPDDIREPHPTEVEEGDRAVMLAGILCKDREFQSFLKAKDERAAGDVLRKQLGIASRSELRTNPRARREFYALQKQFVGDF